jgi:hypothetical protein
MRKRMCPAFGLTSDRRNLKIFFGVGSVALVRSDPVADDPGTDHIGEEFKFLAVPREDDRAGTAAAIDLGNLIAFSQRECQVRPGPRPWARAIGRCRFFVRRRGRREFPRALSQISGRAGDFPFLLERAGGNFHFGADAGPVVVLAFERESQPVVARGSDISEQHGRQIVLGDEQIDGAVAIVIKSDHAARIVKNNLIEADFMRDVAKAGRPFIAQQRDAPYARLIFSDGHQVEPAIVVVVDCGDAPAAAPAEVRQFRRARMIFRRRCATN